MSLVFDYDGPNLDQGFINLRAGSHPEERLIRGFVETLWQSYEPYADPDFRAGFARDPDGRFWEMYLGCALLEGGKTLLPTSERARHGGQPDLCVTDGERSIWIEAITPDRGQHGPDAVAGPRTMNDGGGWAAAPIRQAQLRTTSAFWTKAKAIRNYVKQGVIGENDVRLIAISASRFGSYVGFEPPLILSSLFPIGQAYVTIDRETGEMIGEGFNREDFIEREGGQVHRTAFLDPYFADISGVIWTRLSLGNPNRQQRPLVFVHNPLANLPLQERWGVWDQEYVVNTADDECTVTNILLP